MCFSTHCLLLMFRWVLCQKKSSNPSKSISILSYFKDICVSSLQHHHLYRYFHPAGKPDLAAQSQAGFPSENLHHEACALHLGIVTVVGFWDVERKKKIWKECEWLRQLLEVTSSHAAKLLYITPAEENLKKDFFPCIKGPTTLLLSPGSGEDSPHTGRWRALQEGAFLTLGKVL